MLHLAQASGKKDLVIALSYRRGLRQTVEGMQLARANGAYCIGITDSSISPISRFAHETFHHLGGIAVLRRLLRRSGLLARRSRRGMRLLSKSVSAGNSKEERSGATPRIPLVSGIKIPVSSVAPFVAPLFQGGITRSNRYRLPIQPQQ